MHTGFFPIVIFDYHRVLRYFSVQELRQMCTEEVDPKAGRGLEWICLNHTDTDLDMYIHMYNIYIYIYITYVYVCM